jgi:N-acetylmuramoyl-L-alanine amidase
MIFLSAGHSTVDSGAAAFGRKEADIAEEFRDLVAFHLFRRKVPCASDGFGDQNPTLADTVKMVGTNRPALEFHCNAGPAQATGVETLSAAKDFVLCTKICDALSGALGIRSRGAKPENSGQHHRLAFVQAGGIIVELFFITSATDLAAYDAKKWAAAKAVAAVLAG